MTISWTDAAIEAALDKYCNGRWRGLSQESDNIIKDQMRAALTAAVELQGLETIGYRASEKSFEKGRRVGRADALEEAASICPCRGNEIRALAKPAVSLKENNKCP